jgi:DNA segregation ATPase FtsK/SpoIIIE-like protein
MDIGEELQLVRHQVAEMMDAIRALSEKQNAQYTDVMLRLDELKLDKELFDLLTEDAAGQMEELYDEAKAVVTAAGKASTSLLQRKLNIGYRKAARLIDQLEEDGIIEAENGGKPRAVLGIGNDDGERNASSSDFDAPDEDELYEAAKALALKVGKASTAMLQRNLGVGYSRAAKLMDMLEDAGVIEHKEGAGPRKVTRSTP